MRGAHHQIISADNYKCFGIPIVIQLTDLPSSNIPDTFLKDILQKERIKYFQYLKNYRENIFEQIYFIK